MVTAWREGFSVEDARPLQDKVGPAETIDGLLAQAASRRG